MRKDFEAYLIQVQKQYTAMNKTIETVNKQIQDGILDPATAENLQKYYDTVCANYERLMYCRYLYNLPPKFIQALQRKKLDREAKRFMAKHADKDSILDENKECIDVISDAVVTEEEA